MDSDNGYEQQLTGSPDCRVDGKMKNDETTDTDTGNGTKVAGKMREYEAGADGGK